MKITDVRVTLLRGQRDWVLVRVYTDEGMTGLGESFFGPGVAEIITQGLRPLVIGQDPMDRGRLYHLMLEKGGMHQHTASGGSAVAAISGVEIALWDIAGKALGVPVYRLLGGKYRDRIRMYADVTQGEPNTPEGWTARAREVADEGFTCIQFDFDGKQAAEYAIDPNSGSITQAELERAVALVGAAREAMGDGVELAVSCHSHWDMVSTLRLAEALLPFDPLWIGNPLPPENIDALARLAARCPIPIRAGQYYYKPEGFRELLLKGACHILNPIMFKVGGLGVMRTIAAMADIEHVPVAIQCTVSPVGIMAGAHLAASMKNFLMMEVHHDRRDVPWYQDIIKGPKPLVDHGYVQVPEAPGLGIDLNEDLVNAHLKPGTAFFAPVT